MRYQPQPFSARCNILEIFESSLPPPNLSILLLGLSSLIGSCRFGAGELALPDFGELGLEAKLGLRLRACAAAVAFSRASSIFASAISSCAAFRACCCSRICCCAVVSFVCIAFSSRGSPFDPVCNLALSCASSRDACAFLSSLECACNTCLLHLVPLGH